MNDLLETIKELKKEKARWVSKIHYLNNKEKRNEYDKKYRLKNRDKKKEYRNTYNGYKSNKISSWKSIGVIDNDFDKLFEKYMNTTNCENCNVLLTRNRYTYKTTKVLDHNHITGEFRNVLCNSCNVRRK